MVKRYSAKPASQRQERVSELIRSFVSQTILRGDISSIAPMDVSVVSATVSPDLRYATVYVVPRPSGTGKKAKTEAVIMERLKRVSSFLRSQLAREMTSRICPELIFEKDNATEHLTKMTNLLHSVMADSPQ